MRAGVIDIGSNSIKLLVADRGGGATVLEIASRTLEVRISKGLGSLEPRLAPEGIEAGIAAIGALAAEAKGLGAERVVAVATSAVRDASNGREFSDRVRSSTGIEIRILTGSEEANLIGRGITTDPALASLQGFSLFDLGGGSLECLAFRGRSVERVVSLPLGCVRLTEMFVGDSSAPLTKADALKVDRHVWEELARSNFPFPVPAAHGVVGTGGTLTTARGIAAARSGHSLVQSDPAIGIPFLGELLAEVGALNLADRRKIPGLPPGRADVFPTALVTLLSLAELGGIREFHHSLRNLRWGVASELLG
jgi:exopolyphosphatase/guanosine-5'-triphosphate,3'-diphosphate pyrophosphatase